MRFSHHGWLLNMGQSGRRSQRLALVCSVKPLRMIDDPTSRVANHELIKSMPIVVQSLNASCLRTKDRAAARADGVRPESRYAGKVWPDIDPNIFDMNFGASTRSSEHSAATRDAGRWCTSVESRSGYADLRAVV